jgi:hypothetical protein
VGHAHRKYGHRAAKLFRQGIAQFA